MFKVNQKVWCAIYGAGVVTEVDGESTVGYSVNVRFNDLTANYTADGKYFVEGNVTLFPYPVEIVKATSVKPSVDWDHVSEDFQYLVQDSNGVCYLYTGKPSQGECQWVTNMLCTPAIHFASFTPGTCDWRDSLVKRPD